MARHFTVIGGGIIGVACALALRRERHAVTLVERDEPGMACSWGNAGLIQIGTPIPLAIPGLWRRLPRLLSDRQSPLVIRWRDFAHLAPFLIRLAAAGRARRVEAISSALAALLAPSAEAHKALAAGTGAAAMMRARGLLFVYRDAAARAGAAWEMDLFRRRGVVVETLDGDALRQLEPALDRGYGHAHFLPDSYYTIDPHGLTRAYAEALVAEGGTIERNEVRDIAVDSQGALTLVTASGRRPVDRLVLATGIEARALARRLGVFAPLASARGYHLMLPAPAITLQGPVVEGGMHFAVTPMEGGIRLAGTVEFARRDTPPDNRRADMLLGMARRMFPGLDGSNAVRWMGHRPALPDSLPMIGPAPASRRAFLAIGHGQFGLTTAALTGRLIAELAGGRAPMIDLAPYRPDRF
jgi:glycine/D-amino acid oxidase-like deaminating enzyme